jgi:hypothetical protein
VGARDEPCDWVDDATLTEEQVRARLDTLEPVKIVVPAGPDSDSHTLSAAP